MPQEKQPVVSEDLFRLKFIGGAQLSPDGTRVAYTITHVDSAKDKEYSAIWILDIASGATHQFTGGTAMDTEPRWSPDGQQLAFVSTRGDKAQIYLIGATGGEARMVTSLKQGVGGGIAWSPDGKQIAFTALTREEPRKPELPYRITRHVYRFNGLEYLDDTVQSLFVVDVATGTPRKLTDDRLLSGSPQWSPDGTEILFTTTMYPDTFETFFNRLRVINLASGDIRTVVQDYSVSSAGWLPDGKHIAFCGVHDAKTIGSKSDLWVLDRQGGTPENRTDGLKFGVDGTMLSDMPVHIFGDKLPISADGNAYVRVQEGGTIQIYEVALSGAESWKSVVGGDRVTAAQSLVGHQLLFLANSYTHPGDLFIINRDGSSERQLTHINDELLAGWTLPKVEHMSFAGSDEAQVEGWIALPSKGDAPYPTLLHIHGGPNWAMGTAWVFETQMLNDAGYAVLMVNHRASTGYGDAFSTAIKGDWGNLDYNDLMAGVDYAIAQGYSDPDRLGVFGLSGGGNLTCWIVGQTRRFKAAVPENPVTNFVSMYGVSDIGDWFIKAQLGGKPYEIPEIYARCAPITYAHTCTTPTLMVQGEHDWRCPAEQSEQFYTTLKANGCIVEMLRFPNEAHGGSIDGTIPTRRAHNEALLEWMNRYVLA